eukprot:TRINITY_DN300_c1_g1_i2.p1 TRINITY_DN300_c1_g1~~TRINITY_DN300_c1_g1_i2.p1  ORF type:complete len:1251 (-),score=548.87 TRINITY_DN300_c1_g1_i2:82-3834(-)
MALVVKNMSENALPFIFYNENNNKFEINKTVIEMLKQVNEPLAVICISGVARTGKSYLMNRLLDRQSGFEIGSSVQPCTRGIYIWGKPLDCTLSTGQTVKAIFLDTEGISAFNRHKNYDMQIFSLSILLSSYFIYNSMATIDMDAIGRLSFVANLTKNIHVKATSDTETNSEDLASFMPKLLWIVRDFALLLQDANGKQINSDEYLEQGLTPAPPKNGESEIQRKSREVKNNVKTSLKSLFSSRGCSAIVRPTEDEYLIRSLDKVNFSTLRQEFREQIEIVKNRVFRELPAKLLNGKPVNGETLLFLAEHYVNAINSGAIPTIESAWDSLISSKFLRGFDAALNEYMEPWINYTGPPLEIDNFEKLHHDATQKGLKEFRRIMPEAEAQHFIQLEDTLIAKRRELRVLNEQASKQNSIELLNELYSEIIESKLKNQSYSTLISLMRDWEILRERFFAASIGSATVSTIYEFEKKILSEAIDSFMNQLMNQITETNKTVENLMEEKNKLKSELIEVKDRSTNQSELKHEIMILKESKTKLETENSELQIKNNVFNAHTKTIEAKCQNLTIQNNNLQKEIETIKKSLQEKEKKLNDNQFEQTNTQKQVSELINAKEKLVQENLQLTTKKNDLQNEINQLKSNNVQFEFQIKQLQTDKSEQSNQISTLKINLSNRENQIKQLQLEIEIAKGDQSKIQNQLKNENEEFKKSNALLSQTQKLNITELEQLRTLEKEISNQLKQANEKNQNYQSEIEILRLQTEEQVGSIAELQQKNEKLDLELIENKSQLELIIKMQAEDQAAQNTILNELEEKSNRIKFLETQLVQLTTEKNTNNKSKINSTNITNNNNNNNNNPLSTPTKLSSIPKPNVKQSLFAPAFNKPQTPSTKTTTGTVVLPPSSNITKSITTPIQPKSNSAKTTTTIISKITSITPKNTTSTAIAKTNSNPTVSTSSSTSSITPLTNEIAKSLSNPQAKSITPISTIIKSENQTNTIASVFTFTSTQNTTPSKKESFGFTLTNNNNNNNNNIDNLIDSSSPSSETNNYVQSLRTSFTAGALAGFVQGFATCPIDVVKNRMQVLGVAKYANISTLSISLPLYTSQGQHISSLWMFKHILRDRGIKGIFRGFTATLLRDIPGYAIYFTVYDLSKSILKSNSNFTEPNPSSQFDIKTASTVIISGGIAGSVYHLTSYPLDVIKSHIQINTSYKNTLACAISIFKKSGVTGFFNGLAPTIIRAFPANAVGFLAYEVTLKFLPS